MLCTSSGILQIVLYLLLSVRDFAPACFVNLGLFTPVTTLTQSSCSPRSGGLLQISADGLMMRVRDTVGARTFSFPCASIWKKKMLCIAGMCSPVAKVLSGHYLETYSSVPPCLFFNEHFADCSGTSPTRTPLSLRSSAIACDGGGDTKTSAEVI